MEQKLTYTVAIDEALAGNLTDEVVEKLEALKASLAKRNAHKSDKPTKNQLANEAIKDEILCLLADGKVRTITEITEALTSLDGASPQKVSALLTQLKKAGLIVRNEIKRKAYFGIA